MSVELGASGTLARVTAVGQVITRPLSTSRPHTRIDGGGVLDRHRGRSCPGARPGGQPPLCEQVRILNPLILYVSRVMPPTHVPHTHVCSRLRGHGRAACFTLSARLVDGAGAGRCRMPRGRVRSGLSRSTGWARLGSPVDGGGRVRNPRRPSSRGSRGPAPAQPNPNHPAPIMLPRLDALDGRQGPDADQGPNARQLGDGDGTRGWSTRAVGRQRGMSWPPCRPILNA